MPMDDLSYIKKHRQVWADKPLIRRIYTEQFYDKLLTNCVSGDYTLEIGSGPGLISDIAPDVLRTDIIYSQWVDFVVDAHTLPYKTNSIDNVIGLDVLHHFENPINVLTEISRVLKVGGRCIFVEPWITPFSKLVYTYLHQEECDTTIEPWLDNTVFDPNKKAFDGNAAIPYKLFTEGVSHFEALVPELRLNRIENFSLFTYLLSLGFKQGTLLPSPLYGVVNSIEQASRGLWKNHFALRALIILERVAD